VDGSTRYHGRSRRALGYRTPNGSYRPERLERQWYSRKYDWSPMPHSIFFSGGYAIHGSYEVSRPRPPGVAWLHSLASKTMQRRCSPWSSGAPATRASS